MFSVRPILDDSCAAEKGLPLFVGGDLEPRPNHEVWRRDLIDELLGHSFELRGVNRAVVVECERALFWCSFRHLGHLSRQGFSCQATYLGLIYLSPLLKFGRNSQP